MVQVNGTRSLEQRLRRDFTGRVKYSTSCPCRTLSPCEASRAMPTRRVPESGSKGREDITIFAFSSPIIALPKGGGEPPIAQKTLKKPHSAWSGTKSEVSYHLRNSLKTKSWSLRLAWHLEQTACRSAANVPSVCLPPGKLMNCQPPVVR